MSTGRYSSFIDSFFAGAAGVDTLLNNASARRINEATRRRDDAFTAANVEATRANAAATRASTEYSQWQNRMAKGFLSDTYDAELALRRQQIKDGIAKLRANQALLPAQQELSQQQLSYNRDALNAKAKLLPAQQAYDSAQLDYNSQMLKSNAQNLPARTELEKSQLEYGVADLKHNQYLQDISTAATTSDMNKVLNAYGRDYSLVDNPDGTVSIKSKDGTQLGDALPYEQAMYFIKNPSAYSAASVEAMLQANAEATSRAPAMLPNVSQGRQPVAPTAGATVTVPRNLASPSASGATPTPASSPFKANSSGAPTITPPVVSQGSALTRKMTLWGGN